MMAARQGELGNRLGIVLAGNLQIANVSPLLQPLLAAVMDTVGERASGARAPKVAAFVLSNLVVSST